jgi:hypothetical protein
VPGVPPPPPLDPPLLWSPWKNSTVDNIFLVFKNTTLCLFADDSLLHRQVKNQTDSNDLQKDLSALEEWESKWQMSFHPAKCTVIRISTNRRNVLDTHYFLHGHKVTNKK